MSDRPPPNQPKKSKPKHSAGEQFVFKVLGKPIYAVILHTVPRRREPLFVATFGRRMTSADFDSLEYQSELLFYGLTQVESIYSGGWEPVAPVTFGTKFHPPTTRVVFRDPFTKHLVFQAERLDLDSLEEVPANCVRGLIRGFEFAGERAIRYHSYIRLLGINLYPDVEDFLGTDEDPSMLETIWYRSAKKQLQDLGIDPEAIMRGE